jgi:hypothetical protein
LKRKLSQSEIYQEINLGDLLGRTPTRDEAQAFAQEAIERIIERSQSGTDVNGKQFKQYTKEYAEEKGVSRGDVDMTLLGDMLLSIDSRISGDRIRIEIPSSESAKAYGHITGFKGHPTIPQGKYKRDFFGLSRNEAEQIAESVKDQSFAPDELNISDILSKIGLLAEDDSGNQG